MTAARCPTHPRWPADDCPVCEARIVRQEIETEDPSDDSGLEIDEARYERWLDEIGEP